MAKQDPQSDRISWAIRLSPLLVALILAVLWIAGAPSSIPDLRFSAPVVARPGTTIGLRAWQLDEDDEGYTVVASPPVVVELRNAAGMPLASTELTPSLVHGREGQLRIPAELNDTLSLLATAQVDGQEVTVTRALYVRESIDSRLPTGRTVTAFQAYELGPIRVLDSRRAVEVLDPRIEEGACVPELRCMLSVWVGKQDVSVRLRSLAGIRVDPSVNRASSGFARFPIVVSGSEGRVDVEALDPDGNLLAAREVRLPLVPGGIVARASANGDRIRVDWQQLGERRAVLVDVFQGRRWVHALSLSPDDPYLRRPRPGRLAPADSSRSLFGQHGRHLEFRGRRPDSSGPGARRGHGRPRGCRSARARSTCPGGPRWRSSRSVRRRRDCGLVCGAELRRRSGGVWDELPAGRRPSRRARSRTQALASGRGDLPHRFDRGGGLAAGRASCTSARAPAPRRARRRGLARSANAFLGPRSLGVRALGLRADGGARAL